MQTQATVTTENASSLTKKLCRHFAHKVPTTLQGDQGIIDFPFGRCRIDAHPDQLVMNIQLKKSESADKAEEVLGKHLIRMGHHENLQVDWVRSEHPAVS